jgi:transposase
MLKVSKNLVVTTIGRLKKYGISQTHPKAGHPRKLSNRATRTLIREGTNNPMTTLTELQSSLAEKEKASRRISVSTAL